MWLGDLAWTNVPLSALDAVTAQLAAERRKIQLDGQRAIRRVQERTAPNPVVLLEDTLSSTAQFSRRLDDNVLLLGLQAVLKRLDPTWIGVNCFEAIPPGAWRPAKWYRLEFFLSQEQNGQQVLFLTRDLPEQDRADLVASSDPVSQLACINYQSDSSGAAPQEGLRLWTVVAESWDRAIAYLQQAIENRLREAGMLITLQASDGTSPPQAETSTGGTPEASEAPTAPVLVSDLSRPFSRWDGFIRPIPIDSKELAAELEAECVATRADPSHLGITAIQQWRDGNDAVHSTIASAQNTIFDPDLLVTFARISEHLLEDDEAAELFYRRAFEQPNAEQTANWFWIYFLLVRGRHDEAMRSIGGISDFINWLQATSISMETHGRPPERDAFLEVFSKYTPVTGGSGIEACTMWELLYDQPPPDSATLPALRLLGHARFLERQHHLSAAQTEYDGALNAAQALSMPEAITATVMVAHLRYLRRLQLDRKLDSANLGTRWRNADMRFHSNEEFRKQYLAFLILSGDDPAATEQLRNEFLAYRSAT
jgi:hypothetical protein